MRCKLCRNGEAIENSHVLPKFATKYLKNTGTGYLRRPETPNLRPQDSLKIPLLCRECEQLFGKYETYFANNVFHKINKDQFEGIQSDDYIYRFSISLLWRAAIVYLDDSSSTKEPYRDVVVEAESEWRDYLLNNRSTLNNEEVLVIIWSQAPPEVQNLNAYLLRSLDSTLAFIGDQRAFLYSKIGRVMIISNLVGNDGQYSDVKITPKGGSIKLKQGINDEGIFGYMKHRATETTDLMSNQSDENLRKQLDWIEKNPHKYYGTNQQEVEEMDSPNTNEK